MPPPLLTPAPPADADTAAAHEAHHVHAVYDAIAPHFAATRYKPWPRVTAFLASLPVGSVGLDAGTGAGQYLPLRTDALCTIGLDRSRALLEIAQWRGADAVASSRLRQDVVWGDALALSWRAGAFDYALSIATLHHFATAARRRAALETLLRSINPAHGRILICVWAAEQGAESRRTLPPGVAQDVFVPWVRGAGGEGQERVFRRYYHMFRAGELRALVCEAAQAVGLEVGVCDAGARTRTRGLEIVHEGWERSNWYVELRRWEVVP